MPLNSRICFPHKFRRLILIVVSALLTAAQVVAQEPSVIMSGETGAYQVENHQGSHYRWVIYSDPSFAAPAPESDALFSGGNQSAAVSIQWKKPGVYFIAVTETDITDCENTKALVVHVLQNDRSVAFASSAGSSCFNPEGNDFDIPLMALNHEGQSLEDEYFPLSISFRVNGTEHLETIEPDNRVLRIRDHWFNPGVELETQVAVELVSVTDHQGLPVNISESNYLHTLIALPEVSFAQEGPDTIPLNSFYSFQARYQNGYAWSWWFENELGEKISLKSVTHEAENRFWDREGEYRLYVQARNQAGCLSVPQSKPFVVVKVENFLPSLVALPDINVGYENNLITGNVSINDFDFMDQPLNRVYTIRGTAPEGLTFYDDGYYEYQPAEGFTGKVHFTYQVCFENRTEECTTAEVEIRVLPARSAGNIAPVASADAALALPGKTVISNLLANDIDPDGYNMPLTINPVPVQNPSGGTVIINADGSFEYTSDPGFRGIDRFRYQVCDQGNPALCDSAWVYVIVSEFGNNGQKPISASDDMFLYIAGVRFSLNGNDHGLPGEKLIYNTTPVIDVVHGTLELHPDGTFRYFPDEGFIGVDWFVYTVCNTADEPECARGTGFIVVSPGRESVAAAGSDTVIGSCQPYMLQALDFGSGFQYSWEPAGSLDDPFSRTPVFAPDTTTQFRLTVTNNYGFKTNGTVTIEVSAVHADAGTDRFINRHEQAVLDGSGSTGEGILYSWSTNDGIIVSGQTTAHPVIGKWGTYILEVTDRFGCMDTDTVVAGLMTYAPVVRDDHDSTAYETEVKIDVLANDEDPDNNLDPASLMVKTSPFNGTASVNYGDYTITYRPNNNFSGSDSFTYQVCDSSLLCKSATVFVLVSDFRFFIPDAFSPNNDGINDYFEILGVSEYEGNTLEIFNRWGNRVYRAVNYGKDTSPRYWDGKSNTGVRLGDEELPTGTYFYVLDLGNGEKRIVGSVYLDR